MRLALKIATRFLSNNKGQTIMIILGIAIGVSVQVFIGLLIQGLQAGLIDKTVGNSSQITILSTKDDQRIMDYDKNYTFIQNDSRIKSATVAADGAGFIEFNDQTQSVIFRGFTLEDADRIYGFSDKLTEGELPGLNEVIVGKGLEEELGLTVGDTLTVITPMGETTTVNISGFFDFKVAAINQSWLVTDLETTQNIFGYGNDITAIEMQVKDIFEADIIADDLLLQLNRSDIEVQNWKAQNEELLSGLNGQSISSYMIQVFVLVAVVLGIASVLAISVLQKSRQIGILKAMGIKDRTASLVFLFQGLILGILGAITGVLLGLFLCISFTKFALNPDGTPVIDLTIDVGFIAFSGLVAILSAMVASLIPARKSSKLNPIEVIRNA